MTNNGVVGKHDDEIDSRDGYDEVERRMSNTNDKSFDISASLEDLKGEFDTNDTFLNDDSDGLNQELSHSRRCTILKNEARLAESSRGKSDSYLCVNHEPNVKSQNGLKSDKQHLSNEFAKVTGHVNSNVVRETEGSSSKSAIVVVEHVTVDDVASAVCGMKPVEDDVLNKVERLQVKI